MDDHMEAINAEMQKCEVELRGSFGENYDRMMALANKYAVSEGMTDEYLEISGLGRNPAKIREFARLGLELERQEQFAADQTRHVEEAKVNQAKEDEHQDLVEMKKDPRYWDQSRRDPRFVRNVEEGYRSLFPGVAATHYVAPSTSNRDASLAEGAGKDPDPGAGTLLK